MTDHWLELELTELLRDMRHHAGLTGTELGKRLGVALSTNGGCPQVTHYERGRKLPKPEMIGRWAAACGFHASIHVHGEYEFGPPLWVVRLNDGPQP
jgi:transcriptional regulator with XRE-family HTH domain